MNIFQALKREKLMDLSMYNVCLFYKSYGHLSLNFYHLHARKTPRTMLIFVASRSSWGKTHCYDPEFSAAEYYIALCASSLCIHMYCKWKHMDRKKTKTPRIRPKYAIDFWVGGEWSNKRKGKEKEKKKKKKKKRESELLQHL